MRKKVLSVFRSGKFIIAVVILLLIAIALVSFRENMRRKTLYFVYKYNTEAPFGDEVITKEVQIMSDKGKTEMYVYFDDLEDKEIAAKYEELYDVNAYSDKRKSDKFEERWRKTQEIMYDEKISRYLEEME